MTRIASTATLAQNDSPGDCVDESVRQLFSKPASTNLGLLQRVYIDATAAAAPTLPSTELATCVTEEEPVPSLLVIPVIPPTHCAKKGGVLLQV